MVAALRVLFAAAWLLSGVVGATAQGYPTKPVRVVVGFPAGGPTDAIARIVAQKLTDNLGHQFFVENIGGAGGNIAAGQVARVTPDGYTIMVVSTGFVVNPSLYAKVPYDPVKDFVPVTLVAVSPNVVVVNPQVAAKTLPELVQLIRDNPGKYGFAGPGIGSTPHLGGELFRLAFKLDLVHVPFTGAGPAIQATVGGHTPIAFTALPPALSAVQSGQLRALGVASTERAAGMPDVPTFAEQGIKGQDADTLTGIVAPAGTPKEIVDLLYREIAKIAAQPDVKERLTVLGFKPVANTPDQFGERIKLEMEQVGQGSRRCQVADRVVYLAPALRWRRFRNGIGDGREGQANTLLLDPCDPALVHGGGIVCHHQAKVLRHKGRVVDVDRRSLARDIPYHAGHDGTARRNIGSLVNLGPRILSFLFHAVLSRSIQAARLAQNIKQVGAYAPENRNRRGLRPTRLSAGSIVQSGNEFRLLIRRCAPRHHGLADRGDGTIALPPNDWRTDAMGRQAWS